MLLELHIEGEEGARRTVSVEEFSRNCIAEAMETLLKGLANATPDFYVSLREGDFSYSSALQGWGNILYGSQNGVMFTECYQRFGEFLYDCINRFSAPA